MQKLQSIVKSTMGTVVTLTMPGMIQDLPLAFGDLWSKVEAFKIDKGSLYVVSAHPAFHWSVRMRKKEIVDNLKVYGVTDICLRRKI